METTFRYDAMNRLTEEHRVGAAFRKAEKAWVKDGHLSADDNRLAGLSSNKNPDISDSNFITEYTEITDIITDNQLTEGERYIYDLCGNRTKKETVHNGLVDLQETYCYNEKNQLTERCSLAEITRYTYDLNGNLLLENSAGESREYRYDLLDRQTLIKTAEGREQENHYDGEGYRTGLTIDGITSSFLYYNGEILAESDGEGNPVRRHQSGIGHSLSFTQTLSDQAYHAYHQDDQGSTAYITGMDGKTENSYLYDAFGNLLESREAIENRILYTGQQYDQETGQYYLRARYYNPATSRMLSEDTYRGDGLNLYAYCSNNPVIYYDWSGHNQEKYNNGQVPPSESGGEVTLNDDALVVRGGTSTPDNLRTNQSKDSRGHISANSGNNKPLDVLATTPKPFPNGQVSVTTVGDIRNIGMDVIPDPTPNNPLHASIVPNSVPITTTEAEQLSSLFERQENVWR